MNKGRQLPRTNTILQNENAALRNKVKSLEEALEAAYKIISEDLYMQITFKDRAVWLKKMKN